MKKLLFFIPVLLIIVFWKNVIFNLSTHLYDWHDAPFVIWILQNNIRHFANLDFGILYETNAMYPFPLSLSFTEHMFFPSLLNFVISWFTGNQITQFNLLAIMNQLLIYLSFYLLSGRLTKNMWIRTTSSFFIAFSPYYFSQSGHFQMLFYWPLLLSLYFMFSQKKDLMTIVLTGLFLGFQFLSSIYLGIMTLFMVFLYYFIKAIMSRHKNIIGLLKEFGVVMIVFLIVSAPSINGYLEMYNMYKPSYNQGQYVTYSAHLSDYVFPSVQQSSLYAPLQGLKTFDKHTNGEKAALIGIIPLILIFISLILSIRLRSVKRVISIRDIGSTKSLIIWSLLIIIFGLIFSLGPRMNFNGKYLVTPLPYWVILKYVPFIGVLRAVARWYFVVVFGIGIILIFTLNYLQTYFHAKKIGKFFLPLVFLLFVLEFYPLPITVSAPLWWTSGYEKTREICEKNPGALLEYPFEYRAQDNTVSKNLSYKTHALMASMQHDCEILSGFSAYEPKKFLEYQKFFQNRNFDRNTMKLLIDLGFKYIKFNLLAMNPSEKKYLLWFTTTEYTDILYQDSQTILVKIKPLKPLPKLLKQ